MGKNRISSRSACTDRADQNGAKTQPVDVKAYTVVEFCRAYRLSKAVYYRMKLEGVAPRAYRIGRREYISSEDAAKWQRTVIEFETATSSSDQWGRRRR